MLLFKRKLKNQMCLSIIFCCLTIPLNACLSAKPVYFDDDKKMANELVQEFHRLYNDQNYDGIFDLSTTKQQKLQSKKQFIFALEDLYTKAGKVIDTKQLQIVVETKASHRVVRMFYSTNFEKKTIFEEFDCIVDGETAKLDFYGQPKKLSKKSG